MKLVIAEKPSVAQDLARVLGASQRRDGYCEGMAYLVSWCYDHLAGLADAGAYNERYAKWKLEDLPILPNPSASSLPRISRNSLKSCVLL